MAGLDAGTALEVLTAVRCLADLRRTIIMSLHQPSPEMFSLLDKCLLLTRGGYPAYFGKASRCSDNLRAFVSVWMVILKCPNDERLRSTAPFCKHVSGLTLMLSLPLLPAAVLTSDDLLLHHIQIVETGCSRAHDCGDCC